MGIRMNASISPQQRHHRIRVAVCCKIPERSLMKWDGMDNVLNSTLKSSAPNHTLMMEVIDASGSRLRTLRTALYCGRRLHRHTLLNLDAVLRHPHGLSMYVPQRRTILDVNE